MTFTCVEDIGLDELESSCRTVGDGPAASRREGCEKGGLNANERQSDEDRADEADSGEERSALAAQALVMDTIKRAMDFLRDAQRRRVVAGEGSAGWRPPSEQCGGRHVSGGAKAVSVRVLTILRGSRLRGGSAPQHGMDPEREAKAPARCT